MPYNMNTLNRQIPISNYNLAFHILSKVQLNSKFKQFAATLLPVISHTKKWGGGLQNLSSTITHGKVRLWT
jgi:hypothetical protein